MRVFEINAQEATISSTYIKGKIALSFYADTDEVAALLSLDAIIANFSAEDLLDWIGADKAKEHFGLVDEDA